MVAKNHCTCCCPQLNQDLLDAIAIRFAGLCNELQVVAKSSSYTDALVLLYKELLTLAKSKATEIPASGSSSSSSSSTAMAVVQAPGGGKSQPASKVKRAEEAAILAAHKEKRKGLEALGRRPGVLHHQGSSIKERFVAGGATRVPLNV